MSRNRSSSLPPAIATRAAPFSDHLPDDSVIQNPLAIARSISTNTDAPIPPLNRIEWNAGLGPIRKRSASDPTSVVRVLTKPPVRDDGETLSASRDENQSSSDESSIEDAWGSVRSKDAVRRYHALKELLATEYGYLEDLRFLVTVYLRNLPTLVMRSLCSTSTFASFTTGPSSSWMHSSTSHASSITGQSPELSNVPISTSSYPKSPSSRFLFTDHEVELLTRNGEEILQLHEHFVKDLCMVLEPLGFSRESDESDGPREPHLADLLQLANVDEAIRIVSTKFSTEASRFNIYQTFCAGHPEAMDVLRKALQQFPLELDLFEHRSSSVVSEMLGSKNKLVLREASSTQRLASGSKSLSVHAIMPPALEDRKRTLSLTSLEDRKDSKLKATSSPKSLKLRASMTAMTAISISSNNKEKGDAVARLLDDRTSSDLQCSATTSSGGTNVSEATKLKERDKSSARKIAMADYMIKPVQRICKYPLLLDQLLPSKALRDVTRKGAPDAGGDVDVVVESAAQAMRHVAASVDAARERQSIATQSSLIFSRICLGLQVQGMLSSGSISHSYSSYSGSPPHLISSSSRCSAPTQTQNSPQLRLPTPTFLSSLGPCLLSGSLDVIHYSHSVSAWLTGAIKSKIKMKAKYLGAFLYNGGYLIFVKAGKGKRYEPRHWFALDGWDIVSIDEEEAMLPHSFRLSKTGQHFELAASCAREKNVWLASISEAIKHVATWSREPIPSFMCNGSRFTVESTPPSAPGSDDGHESVDLVEEGLTSSSGDVGALPTICSIPDICETNGPALESEPRVARTEPFFASLREHVNGKSGRRKKLSTMSGGGSKRHPQPPQLDEEPPSRRSSSSTSVMSIFSPIHLASHDREKEKDRERETETVLITRSSATARQAIDSELQDVISASCASARADAAWREKVDVGPGAVWGSAKAKTSSSIAMGSMSRGMARLSKHESVRVPRKRTSVTIETLSRSAASSVSIKGTSGRKTVKKLSLTSFSSIDYDKPTTDLQDEPTPNTTSDSPQDSPSQPSMENLSVIPISTTLISVPSDTSQTKPSRSFVQNVKDLFHFRPSIIAPVSVIVSHPTQTSLQSVAYMDVLQQENKIATNANRAIYPMGGLLKNFVKDSGRPHGKSVADGDEFDFVTITSIHEADENLVKDKVSMAIPVMATGPSRPTPYYTVS